MTTYKEQKETRSAHSLETAQVRSDGKMNIRGYIAKYNTPAWFRGYPEVIRRGAFSESLRAVQNGEKELYALYNHDTGRPLARTGNGSLKIEDRDDGLYATMELPNTTFAKDVYEMVDSGHCAGASFGMVERLKDFGIEGGIRQIGTVTLEEVTVTPIPIHPSTSMSTRAYDAFKELDEQKEQMYELQDKVTALLQR